LNDPNAKAGMPLTVKLGLSSSRMASAAKRKSTLVPVASQGVAGSASQRRPSSTHWPPAVAVKTPSREAR
jgi:hypothetical protein